MKIYPSSYAVPAGHTTDTSYNSGCLRYQTYKRHIPRENSDFPKLYETIGHLGELYALNHITEPKEIESPLSEEYNGVKISGRIDCLTDACIYEFKTSINKTKATRIRQGEFDPKHIGQLVTYMVMLGRSRGCLVDMYARFDRNLTGLHFISRWYRVELIRGIVMVNDQLHKPVTEILQYYTNMAEALRTQDTVLPPTPISEKPCTFCPLQDICFSTKDPAEFVRKVKEVEIQPSTRNPSISVHDVRDKVTNYGLEEFNAWKVSQSLT